MTGDLARLQFAVPMSFLLVMTFRNYCCVGVDQMADSALSGYIRSVLTA